jgi:hypothetical protein
MDIKGRTMYSPFEDKGKIFTEVIQKKPVEVIIQTSQQKIHGTIHIRPKERLKDELDNLNTYLAVTDATILDAQENVIQRTHFMVIHRDHIIWLSPVEEIETEESQK